VRLRRASRGGVTGAPGHNCAREVLRDLGAISRIGSQGENHAWIRIGDCAALYLLLSGCGYNELQRRDEQVKAAWAEVLNQYQRRADLVQNLVNTVKGYAAQEQQVLRQVTEARARVGSIQATPELVDNPRRSPSSRRRRPS